MTRMCVSKMAKCMILFKADKTKVCYQKQKKKFVRIHSNLIRLLMKNDKYFCARGVALERLGWSGYLLGLCSLVTCNCST